MPQKHLSDGVGVHIYIYLLEEHTRTASAGLRNTSKLIIPLVAKHIKTHNKKNTTTQSANLS